MRRRSLFVLAMAVLASSVPTFADFVVYNDDFSTNTFANYTWTDEGNGGDGDPANNFTYDAENQWITITTADNENIRMSASLSSTIETGRFQIDFMPTRTYPTDGAVQLRLYGVDGTLYSYQWDFAHDSGLDDPGAQDVYRAHLEKWVNGVAVIEEVFVPSPDHYDLGIWHTLAMDFSPSSMTGYLDGDTILAGSDPTLSSIAIVSFEIVFRQQDQYVDNILISVVPVPGAALLGVLGLGYAGVRLRRQQ